MAYDYINETGIIVTDTSEIRAEVEQAYKDAFNNQDLVVDNGSPASVLITVDTTTRKNLQEALALFANQINPNIASGVFLDDLWALTNGQRRQATSTTVTATVTGVAGTVLPAGTVAETADGDRFETISEITIPASGTIDISFQSIEKGAIPCPAGALTNIADGGVLGWETITNANAGILGAETQDDASARVDRLLTLALGAKATLFAIASGLYAINDVKSIQLLENYKNTTEVIDGVTMVPHSIYLCVDGATDDEVVEALYAYKTIGCNYSNGASSTPITHTITAEDTGKPYTAKFDRPDEIQIKIKISVKADARTANPIEEVKQAILNYTNSTIRTEGFKVDKDVSPFEITQNVSASTKYYVADCQITKASVDVWQRETIAINVWEKAVTSANLIEVVLL